MIELERKLTTNAESSSEVQTKQDKTLDSYHLEFVFSDGTHSIRKAENIQNQKTEVLLLFRSLVDSGLITKSDVQSDILRGRAGRKGLEIDKSGKVNGTMKPLNKQVVELWNDGKEPPEIATISRPKKKNKSRQDFISRIRRILWTNQRLLLRPYSQ